MANRAPCGICSIATFNSGGPLKYSVTVLLGDGNCQNCETEARRLAGLGDGVGTKDGSGAGNHDEPYTFGRPDKVVHNLSVEAQSKLIRLRGAVLERKLAAHIPTPDPDGL